ncbi:unnamed protein product [Ectocarpus sp. 13 AM-2016]
MQSKKKIPKTCVTRASGTPAQNRLWRYPLVTCLYVALGQDAKCSGIQRFPFIPPRKCPCPFPLSTMLVVWREANVTHFEPRFKRKCTRDMYVRGLLSLSSWLHVR